MRTNFAESRLKQIIKTFDLINVPLKKQSKIVDESKPQIVPFTKNIKMEL